VRRFDLVATIAREAKRSEIAPVLVWASSQVAQRHGLDPAALASELLGPGAGMVTVAKRLLLICRDLRLVNDDLTGLTDDGVRAAQSGHVLQPEKGEWTVWVCEDPLVEFPIVGIAPRTADVNGNDREPRRRNGPRPRAEPMPGWVLWAQNRAASLLADGQLARFDDISAPAIETSGTDELQLFWTPGGEPEAHAVGVIGPKARVDEPLPVSELPSKDQVWAGLLGSRRIAQSWDSRRSALCIPFKATTTDDERLNMRTSLTFKSPTVERFGEFRDLTVPDITLCPDSDQSASEWARYQIVSQLGGVQTEKVFAALSARVRGVFDGWTVQMPSRESLATDLAARHTGGPRSRAYWAIQSALDWGL
jgi:hypothetical protein